MRRIAATLVLVTLGAALTGCGTGGLGATSVMCASWAVYESEDDLTRDAQAIVTVADIERDGSQQYLGADAAAYRTTIRSVDRGDLAVGDTLRVVSTADGCGPAYGGAADPMLGGDVLRLYLREDDGFWHTLSPFAGVVVTD